ncbi:hypothetical protein M758_6G068900 [Ceratodon purpureus]|nr:hypothetical protein M758_6G068900 [Ceratodon purpureus]
MAEILRKFEIDQAAMKKGEKKPSSSNDAYLKPSPLRDVVARCEKNWHEQTLRSAKCGNVAMQTLIGQMLCSGYGAAVNVKEGITWLQKAAKKDQEAFNMLTTLSRTGINTGTPTGL